MSAVGVMTFVANGLFVVAGLAAVRLWVRHRSPATRWLAATFGVFVFIIVLSLLPKAMLEHPLVVRVVIVLLLGSPYLLYRFADAVVPASAGLRRLATVITGALVLATLGWPRLEDIGQADGPPFETAYVVFALGVWGALLVPAGWRLWRGSVGEPGVVRNRLRVLAAATIGLGVLIPASSLLGEDPAPAAALAVKAVTVVLGGLFLVGFAPPSTLRAAWRHEDERRMYEAAVALMAAEEPRHVADVLVPGARQLLGAPRVTLFGTSGLVLASAGEDPGRPGQEVVERAIGERRLEIIVSPTMPLFGSDELLQLDRLALLAELAFDRSRLLALERETRTDLERVNEELEAFVYTTSHDLKNPVIALLGYLDVIREDHEDALPDDVRHHLARMDVNVRHMESLIRDLLELSRVGRVDVLPDVVDLGRLVDDVARDVLAAHPGLRVVRDDLPQLWMNPTRARQLVTNLVDNAARYGGRDDVTVTVRSEPLEDGMRITVDDDGRGIPDAYLDRVFGVFERLDPESPGGTGMGLAICRRVVEHLGGRIRAVPSDRGARFQVDLPASAVRVPPVGVPSRGTALAEGAPA